MADKLFVYGRLGPGRPDEHVLKSIGGRWKKASVRGTLRQQGWGAEMGYWKKWAVPNRHQTV